jgi:hypothetical protein
MSDKQILAWLKSKRNGAHTQYWNARKLVDELETLVAVTQRKGNE